MTNKIKFDQKYDAAFPGATGWGNNYEFAPFFAYTDECVIMVAKNGITIVYHDPNMWCWYNSENYSYFTAKLVVQGLEKLNLTDFLDIVKTDDEFTWQGSLY